MPPETKPQRITWYRSPVSRENLRELNKRSNLKGFLQAGGYLALIMVTGIASYLSVGRLPWFGVVFLLFIHGTCCAFMINGFHELVHDSVFRTRALNRGFLRIFSFLGFLNHHQFWASHTEHHKYTLHPPDDLEVVLPVKMTLMGYLSAAIIHPKDLVFRLWNTIRIAIGKIDGKWDQYLFPESQPTQRRMLIRWARILLIGHGTIIAVSLYLGWWMFPIVFTLSQFYGGWLFLLCNNTQHAGLQDNVSDFRLCCRTVTLNPVLRFLYWNMNYHTEHHMYAAVPCYNLGKLHRLIRDDLPHCPHGLIEAWTQIITVFRKQRTQPDYYFVAKLPMHQKAN